MKKVFERLAPLFVFLITLIVHLELANAGGKMVAGVLSFHDGDSHIITSDSPPQDIIVDLSNFDREHMDFLTKLTGTPMLFKLNYNQKKPKLDSASLRDVNTDLYIYPSGIEYGGALESSKQGSPIVKIDIPEKESLIFSISGNLITNFRIHSFMNLLEDLNLPKEQPVFDSARTVITGKIADSETIEVASVRLPMEQASLENVTASKRYPVIATGKLQVKIVQRSGTQYFLRLPTNEELWLYDEEGRLPKYLGKDVAIRGSSNGSLLELDQAEGIFSASDNILTQCANELIF